MTMLSVFLELYFFLSLSTTEHVSINSNVVFHRLPSPATSFHKCIEPKYMDQISIKTPNPKCRLYWRFIDFIDWRYSHSCWYFRPLLWTSAPLSFWLVHLPPSPLPCVNKNRGTCIHTVCNSLTGDGIGGLRQINTCRQVPLLVKF
jgi:hypothetical protein